MGQNLVDLLEDAIQEVIDDDSTEETSRADVVGRIAEGSGVERGTINDIIEGDIECPPPARVAPLARDLPIEQEDVESALAEDGCERFDNAEKRLSYEYLAKRAEGELSDPNA